MLQPQNIQARPASTTGILVRARQFLDTRPFLLSLGVVTLTVALVHFRYFRELGFYQDDYTFMSRPLGWSWGDLAAQIQGAWTVWPLGRPLGFSLPQTLAFIGGHLGGVPGEYVMTFLVLLLNCFLVYAIFKKLGSEIFAFSGAMAFAIFPADTTRPFLMHGAGLQPALTFVLVATLLYLSGRRALAYPIAALALLTYETPFMLFIGIPLLMPRWDRKFARQFALHVIICLILIASVFTVRGFMGEARVEGLTATSPLETLYQIAAGTVLGPATAAWSFVLRPFTALTQTGQNGSTLLLVELLLFIVIAARFALLPTLPISSNRASAFKTRLLGRDIVLSPRVMDILAQSHAHLAFAGLVLLALAYGLSFTHFPPTTLAGQGTSVHLAASFATALLFGWLCAWLWLLASTRRTHLVLILALSFYLALLGGFQSIVSSEYRFAWQAERKFWTQVVALVPDLDENTVIVTPRKGLESTIYVAAHEWPVPLVLDQLYRFPFPYASIPRAYVLDNNWKDQARVENGAFSFFMPQYPDGYWVNMPQSQFVLLETENGKMVRRTGSVIIHGQEFSLKPPGAPKTPAYAKGALYEVMFGH